MTLGYRSGTDDEERAEANLFFLIANESRSSLDDPRETSKDILAVDGVILLPPASGPLESGDCWNA
jgi:hypothetical protein